jgi:hypothetical protein
LSKTEIKQQSLLYLIFVLQVRKPYIKYTTLTKVENGVVKKPNVQTMAKIAKGLGIL